MEANSVHVMKMSSAFCRQGASVALVHTGGQKQTTLSIDESNVSNFYGADARVKRVQIPIGRFLRARRYAMRAARVASRYKADLAYCRDVFSCLAALQRNIPAMLELHSLPSRDSQTGKALCRIFGNRLLLRTVVITKSLGRELCDLYHLPESEVVVCADAADDLSHCVPKPIGSKDRIQVGYLGSMLPGKGMEIIAALPALCPGADFHVVGGSAKQVADWQIKLRDYPNIVFHGHVSPSETGEYLAAFDIALAPNQAKVIVRGGTDIGKFTSPMKLFEYMSAGNPIIASDLPVLHEVLQHNRNALLCDPERPAVWRDAIALLSTHKGLTSQLSANARDDFQRHWSWDARAKRLLKIAAGNW